jgi:hypothetical protein
VVFSSDFQVLERSSIKNKEETQIVAWKPAVQVDHQNEQDEEAIAIDLKKLGNNFIFIYLHSDNFDKHLDRLETAKNATYRLFESDTNTNFSTGTLGEEHAGMFFVNPEDLKPKVNENTEPSEPPIPVQNLNCIVGCYLIYKSNDSVYFDQVKSHCFDRQPEEVLLGRLQESFKETAGMGDFNSLQTFWQSKLEKKRQGENSVEGRKKVNRNLTMVSCWTHSRTMMMSPKVIKEPRNNR